MFARKTLHAFCFPRNPLIKTTTTNTTTTTITRTIITKNDNYNNNNAYNKILNKNSKANNLIHCQMLHNSKVMQAGRMDHVKNIVGLPDENDGVNSTPLRLSNLQMGKSVLSSFGVDDLIKARVHYGHHKSMWHPQFRPYIYGIREDTHIIDLDQTIFHLKRALNVLRYLAYDKVRIAFISSVAEFDKIIRHEAIRCGAMYNTRRWIPGTLTNSDLVLGASEEPEFMVLFTPHRSSVAVTEAETALIPTMGICDSNFNPRLVHYAIPGNDDSVEAQTLYAKLIADAIIEGKTCAQYNIPL